MHRSIERLQASAEVEPVYRTMLRHDEQLDRIPESLHTGNATATDTASLTARRRTQRADAKMSLAEWTKQSSWARGARIYGRVAAAGLITFILAFPTLLLLMSLFPSKPNIIFPIYLTMLFGGLLGGAGCLLAMVLQAFNASAKLPLPRQHDVQDIGGLLDRSLTDYVHQAEISEQLTALLPRLEPGDAPYIAERHYEILNDYLHRAATRSAKLGSGAWGTAYMCAVLDAYARIGDGRALDDVRRIAAGKATSGLLDPACLEAAQRCLPHLEKAAAELRERETLLRAAQSAASDDGLLRPAASAERLDEDGLLRPAEEDKITAAR